MEMDYAFEAQIVRMSVPIQVVRFESEVQSNVLCIDFGDMFRLHIDRRPQRGEDEHFVQRVDHLFRLFPSLIGIKDRSIQI